MKLEPLGDRVVIKRDAKKEKSEGGIFFPTNVKDNSYTYTGQVISVGPGMVNSAGDLIPLVVKAGDQVLFVREPGDEEIELDRQKVCVVKESSILAVVC